MSLLSQNLICSKITLREINSNDINFLYFLRLECFKMPSLKEHEKFVIDYLIREHPYKAWYIIEYEKKRIGSLPLKKTGEFGYIIKKEYQGRGLIHAAFKLFFKLHPKKDLWARTSIHNKRSQGLLKKYGFKLTNYEFR